MRTSNLCFSLSAIFLALDCLFCVYCPSTEPECQTTKDCFAKADCRHYTCDNNMCVYSFTDGQDVTCGNTNCIADSDCASSDIIISYCSNGICVGNLK